MKLKSLEIKGFKSFANDTVIHFNENVIGIVGPNGSGKSNIVDAIRWVLGEQSGKELRLDKMASVIFNGSKSRKPAPVAQVTVTFDNHKHLLPIEYQSVSISRILYRSGDSEYRLNNVSCRLKDINSLLMDTGIGSDTYAIIALGMVDDILNDKEHARRRMFEQAAGISKYKIRKRETLQKLESTTEDLNRVEDLLHELEQNMKSLERQAKRTQKYFDYKNRYKELRTREALLKLEVLESRKQTLQKNADQALDDYRQIEVQFNQSESELQALKLRHIDEEKLRSESQKLLAEIISNIRNMENEQKINDQKLDFLSQNIEKNEKQRKELWDRREQTDKEIKRFQSEIDIQKAQEAVFEAQTKEAENNLSTARTEHYSIKGQLDEALSHQHSLEKELFEKEKKSAVDKSRISGLEIDIKRVENENAQRKTEMLGLKGQLDEKNIGAETLQSQLTQLVTEEKNRVEQLQIHEKALTDIQSSYTGLVRALDQKQNEYNLTKSMIDSLEGYPESIRFLSKSGQLPSETAILSDIIYSKETYRAAIESYLEPVLNFYVVENKNQAWSAIQKLKDAQKGKAGFFILDRFTGEPEIPVALPGMISALDIVQYDEKYKHLVHHLLGKVFIIEQNETATTDAVADQIYLSADGSFSHQVYAITGGSVGLFEGKKIGRKKNLEILIREIDKLQNEKSVSESEKNKLQQAVQSLKSQGLQSKINEVQNKLNGIQQQIIQLRTRSENQNDQLAANEKKIDELKTNIALINANESVITKEIEETRKKLETLRMSISSTDHTVQAAALKVSELSNQFNLSKIEFIKQQNYVSKLRGDSEYRLQQLNETDKNLNTLNAEIDRNTAEKTDIHRKLETLSGLLSEQYEKKKSNETDLNEVEQAFHKSRNRIYEMEENIKKINKRKNDQQILVHEYRDKLNDVRFETNALNERMKIEFEVILSEIKDKTETENTDLQQLETEAQKLKERIANFGEINPLAVEAYEEIKVRFDLITEQRNDILSAKEKLISTIKEIDKTANDLFMQSFYKVRDNFVSIFRTLFTEDDDCDLILDKPDTPLESDIQIIAKPKGKRPQSLNQLSGGEKTLTATALLFALYLLKPAPFCIFDEVDAPLDDMNIEKFNKMIQRFSRESQFIVVTHNKQTMVEVDIIYGVFMEESGVSKVASVDFRTLKQLQI